MTTIAQQLQTELDNLKSQVSAKESELAAALSSGESWIHTEIDTFRANVLSVWSHLFPGNPAPATTIVAAMPSIGGGGGPIEPK